MESGVSGKILDKKTEKLSLQVKKRSVFLPGRRKNPVSDLAEGLG